MKIQVHSKNLKENLDKVQYEFKNMIESLFLKFQFINHEANQADITVEVNKELSFLAKVTLNLVNVGIKVITTDYENNLFKLLSNCRKKLEKQLEKVKHRFTEHN